MAHRMAWELLHGPLGPRIQVHHHCDNPPCVNPEHLWVGSQSENIQDMLAKGRERITWTKINADIVLQMIDEVADGRSYAALGRKFNVSWATVRAAVLGITWKQVVRP